MAFVALNNLLDDVLAKNENEEVRLIPTLLKEATSTDSPRKTSDLKVSELGNNNSLLENTR